MSSTSLHFGPLNVDKKCSNFMQVAPVNMCDLLHHMYHAEKLDADAEYLGRVKMALSTHEVSINFVDPASIRKANK